MISILTPTYNRSNYLLRLYSSLREQSSKDFEWVVVDDGSTDDTSTVVTAWIDEAPFPVRLLRQSNGGKHCAVNSGVEICRGDAVFIVDSDDALTPDAIETVDAAMSRVGGVVPGVCFRKVSFDGELVGRRLTDETPIVLHPTVAGKFFAGDLAYVFAKDALVNNPFPVIRGEKFLPELYVWNRIGDQAGILYFPGHPIYLCEYLSDGYSANFRSNLERSPRGFALFYRNQMFREARFTDRLKCLIRLAQCQFYVLKRWGFRR